MSYNTFNRTKQSQLLNYSKAGACMSRKKVHSCYTLKCKICFTKNMTFSVQVM
jgi:hypothetical protein